MTQAVEIFPRGKKDAFILYFNRMDADSLKTQSAKLKSENCFTKYCSTPRFKFNSIANALEILQSCTY